MTEGSFGKHLSRYEILEGEGVRESVFKKSISHAKVPLAHPQVSGLRPRVLAASMTTKLQMFRRWPDLLSLNIR